MAYQYNPDNLNKLERALSSARLAPYIVNTEGDLERAIKLHLWNAELGESLYIPLQSFELLCRNAVNDALTQDFGPDWFNTQFLDFEENFQKQIKAAKDELLKQGRQIQPCAVIAQFSFGTWVNLLHSRYDRSFWKFTLYRAFPYKPKHFSRRIAKESLEKIRVLRNRIFHHEPIYKRKLDEDLSLLIEVAAWICPSTAEWIKHNTKFEQVWKNRPV